MTNATVEVWPETRRREFCTLLSVGMHRTLAARFVGAALAELNDALAEDPAFEEQVRRSELTWEVGLLHNVQKAGEKNWRASAWLLERLHPEQFARTSARDRQSGVPSPALVEVLEEIVRAVPVERRADVRRRVEQMLADAVRERLPAIPAPRGRRSLSDESDATHERS